LHVSDINFCEAFFISYGQNDFKRITNPHVKVNKLKKTQTSEFVQIIKPSNNNFQWQKFKLTLKETILKTPNIHSLLLFSFLLSTKPFTLSTPKSLERVMQKALLLWTLGDPEAILTQDEGVAPQWLSKKPVIVQCKTCDWFISKVCDWWNTRLVTCRNRSWGCDWWN
jgi:hypothetical protein